MKKGTRPERMRSMTKLEIWKGHLDNLRQRERNGKNVSSLIMHYEKKIALYKGIK